MIDIILLLAGIVMLIKGNVKATKTTEISKPTGRILGAILIAPLLLNFFNGFFFGREAGSLTLHNVEYAIVILIILVTIIFFRKPIR